jgi:GH24 family phage-related lysozyme (muramidase)
MPKSKCLWKWKRAYDTKAKASQAAAELRAKGRQNRGMEAYPCPQGHWHVGNGRVKKRHPGKPKRRY